MPVTACQSLCQLCVEVVGDLTLVTACRVVLSAHPSNDYTA